MHFCARSVLLLFQFLKNFYFNLFSQFVQHFSVEIFNIFVSVTRVKFRVYSVYRAFDNQFCNFVHSVRVVTPFRWYAISIYLDILKFNYFDFQQFKQTFQQFNTFNIQRFQRFQQFEILNTIFNSFNNFSKFKCWK